MKEIEYSLIVRNKLKDLRKKLTQKYGTDISKKSIKKITDSVRSLEIFGLKGMKVSDAYDVECDYRYFYTNHQYIFYRIEEKKIIIVEMFDEREDFMWKLFQIDTTSQETYLFWKE